MSEINRKSCWICLCNPSIPGNVVVGITPGGFLFSHWQYWLRPGCWDRWRAGARTGEPVGPRRAACVFNNHSPLCTWECTASPQPIYRGKPAGSASSNTYSVVHNRAAGWRGDRVFCSALLRKRQWGRAAFASFRPHLRHASSGNTSFCVRCFESDVQKQQSFALSMLRQ